MPKPDWKVHHKVEKPQNDNDYFERMSRVILASGLNWQVLEKKWPGIKAAFANFDINKVAQFDEPEVEKLMGNPDVIRNEGKIWALIANAQTIQDLVKEHGSFAKYLDSLGGEEAVKQDVSKRFKFLGAGTTVIFLFAVGCELPNATKDWEARHQK